MTSLLLLLGGLAVVVIGAELVVRGGSGLAGRLRVPPLVIGLTVVAIGTSSAELAVGIGAVLVGAPGLAISNIVGTNIVNLLLILGLSAAIRPIAVMRQTTRLDGPTVAVAALVLLVLSLDGGLSTLDGLGMIALGVLYTVAVIRFSKRESDEVRAEHQSRYQTPDARKTVLDVVRLVGGIALVVVGADLLVDGAIDIALSLGVSEAFIGLTVVAIGTSAPELVTTVIATIRNQRGLAVGNLIGSSVYNILLILGTTVVVAPGALEVPAEVIRIDMVMMAAVALILVPIFVTGRRISRFEGIAMVAIYLAYLAYLILART